MKDIIIASNNQHKIKEIKQILGDFFDNIYSLKEKGIDIEVDETGKTFYENALIKAREISKISGMSALADDSGLMVEYLNGQPGVYSARFAGYPCDDNNNNKLLLKKLEGVADRRASFVSCIVIYKTDGSIISAEGKTDGEIIFEKKGENGFGYDPIFFSYDLKKTFGEASAREKNQISHRARALKEIAKKL
ncbi:MAG: RdgB/HAM1 family non-canonical purine NTP pyrophosphatase [Bacillota bacterium]